MKLHTAIFAAAIMSLALGCGKKEDDDKTTAETDGTWKTGCVDDDTDNSSSSTDMAISGANITVNVKNYSDKGCVTDSDTWAGNASFTLGESVTSVTGAKKINITSSKYTVTLKADSTVTIYNSFNTTGVCGGGWVKNTAKELNATVCANDTTFKTMFNQSYTIIKIDGTKLNFGQCGDDGSATSCEADDKRPTSLESATYTKS